MMKRLLILGILGVMGAVGAMGATKITASLTFTNGAGTTNGQTITVNGSARTWTNNVALPLTQILTNSTATGAKTNFFKAAPFTSISLVDSGATNVSLVGASGVAMTVTLSAGWGSVSYSTQTVATLGTVRFPIAGEASGAQQTNIASLLVNDLDTLSTNALHESSIISQNLVGITNAQTVSGAKVFASFSGTAGPITNAALLNPTLTNGQNFGDPFRSPGSATGSEQFGTSAVASANYACALGQATTASGLKSLAISDLASASANYAIAVGPESIASGVESSAVGYLTTASGLDSSSFGYGGTATAAGATALGSLAFAVQASSTAVGYHSASTVAHQVRLGTASEYVSIPGNLSVEGSISNISAAGTNVFPAGSDIAFGRYALSSLANGINQDIVVGTNVFVEVSGPTGAFSIEGIAGGRDGKLVIILNQTGFNMTIATEGGSTGNDPTAANRIICLTGADRATTGNGAAILIYNASSSRWILLHLDS